MEIDVPIRARAALLAAPAGSAIARHTAAMLWGGLPPHDWRTHIVTPPRADGRLARTCVEGLDARVSRSESGLAVVKGVRVTDPIRTFLDLAEDCDLVELVTVGDSLVRKGRTTPEKLRAAAATPGRHRLLARRAAGLVRARVMSAPESQLRMLVVLAGLPEPSVDIQFSDEDGRLVRRLDLGYREQKVALEYDGRHHAESPEQWAEDIRRREEFDDLDWRMLIVNSPGLWQVPGQTLDRIVRLLNARGADVAMTSREWQRYFGPRHLRSA